MTYLYKLGLTNWVQDPFDRYNWEVRINELNKQRSCLTARITNSNVVYQPKQNWTIHTNWLDKDKTCWTRIQELVSSFDLLTLPWGWKNGSLSYLARWIERVAVSANWIPWCKIELVQDARWEPRTQNPRSSARPVYDYRNNFLNRSAESDALLFVGSRTSA